MFGSRHHRHHDGCASHGEGRHAMRRGGGFFGGRGGGWDMEGERDGGRRQRVFGGDELRLVLLKLIAETPRHGYDLIRAIEERTGGAYAPSPGVVYPTLTLLAEMGLIAEQHTDGARKLYAVTPEGAQHLAERAAEVEALFARLDALGQARDHLDAMPLRRAVHNLRTVLMHRMATGTLDGEKIHEAVALIDETARKIERL
ncbi:PadR family transcriptional regulator [Roseococcus sp.]|uniref:PadR family transcriptional regulator n=1 Tax=Roseococcus sp. TaxID=2109646 RepID=UPI003BAC3404